MCPLTSVARQTREFTVILIRYVLQTFGLKIAHSDSLDPYQVLGIERHASAEEIKQAYRRVAMKWHPDRNQNSVEAREQFQRAAEAYKTLSKRGKSESGASDNRQHDDSTESGYRYNGGNHGHESRDQSADSVFWDAMLDYAIKLAQTGSNEAEIAEYLGKLGCPQTLTRVIAEKAFNIHAHYAAGSGGRRKGEADQSTFKDERLQAELFRAFLGRPSLVWSPRGTLDYYLLTFREFAQTSLANPLRWVNVNRRLLRMFNFVLILFAAIAVAVNYFPGPAKYKLLSDANMLQLPFLLLPLMLAWMLYRKLWVAGLLCSAIYAAAMVYFEESMTALLNRGPYDFLAFAALCFAPFLVIVLFANFLYYLKLQRMIRTARSLFPDHLDQLVWIQNRAGTSSSAAFFFLLVFVAALVHLVPQHWQVSHAFGSTMPNSKIVKNEAEIKKMRLQTSEAEKFFDIAESHYNDASPDYLKAEMAYDIAADNGSLLAAYKLGYLHFTGNGAVRDPDLAFDYFSRATRAPLAFQPHSLELTTRFLAEAYRNLGIMYQAGLGTPKNIKQAKAMYRKAVEFGSARAKGQLEKAYDSDATALAVALVFPDYR